MELFVTIPNENDIMNKYTLDSGIVCVDLKLEFCYKHYILSNFLDLSVLIQNKIIECTILLRICYLQVLGNAKGAVAVVVSILLFRNPVSITGMLGYSLTVFGVILYGEVKKRGR